MKDNRLPIACSFLTIVIFVIFISICSISRIQHLDLISNTVYSNTSMLNIQILGFLNIFKSYIFHFSPQLFFYVPDFINIPLLLHLTHTDISLMPILMIMWFVFITHTKELKSIVSKLKTSIFLALILTSLGVLAGILTLNPSLIFLRSHFGDFTSSPLINISLVFKTIISHFAYAYIALTITEIIHYYFSKLKIYNTAELKIQAIEMKTVLNVVKKTAIGLFICIVVLITTLFITKNDFFVAKTNNMNIPRGNHSSIELNDGRVLIAGGKQDTGKARRLFSPNEDPMKAEIYDPTTTKFTTTGSLNKTRCKPILLKLPDNRILVFGKDVPGGGYIIKEVEIFDPETNTFSLAGKIQTKYIQNIDVAINTKGQIILGGFKPSTDRGKMYPLIIKTYNCKTMAFEETIETPFLWVKEYPFDIEALPDGKFLFIGNMGKDENLLTYDPLTKKLTPKKIDLQIETMYFKKIININNNGNIWLECYDNKIYLLNYKNGNFKLIKQIYIGEPYTNIFYYNNKFVLYNEDGFQGPESIYVYDIETAKITKLKHLDSKRNGWYDCNTILLKNGTVLITGGSINKGYLNQTINNSEIFNVE